MQEIIKALAQAQLEIHPPKKDKVNPRFKTPYCSLDSIYDACRVPLAKHGLTLSHSVEMVEKGAVLVTTLYHISGENFCNKIPMFLEQQTSQGFASALTYARRYATCSILSMPTDEDDDGESAKEAESKLSDVQVQEISNMVGEDKEMISSILSGYRVKSLKDISQVEFPRIMKALERRKHG